MDTWKNVPNVINNLSGMSVTIIIILAVLYKLVCGNPSCELVFILFFNGNQIPQNKRAGWRDDRLYPLQYLIEVQQCHGVLFKLRCSYSTFLQRHISTSSGEYGTVLPWGWIDNNMRSIGKDWPHCAVGVTLCKKV